MPEHDCSMCRYYSNLEGFCYRYREQHYPSDGETCNGWEYWDDPTYDQEGDLR